MPTQWKLFKIDDVSDGEFNPCSSSYRKKRQKQLLLWKENNFTSDLNSNLSTVKNNESIACNKDKINREECKDVPDDNQPKSTSTKHSKSERTKAERSRIMQKYADKKKKVYQNKKEHNRVQKAKEKFDRDNKKFLEKAIKQYNEKPTFQSDIPNLQSAIKMSIDSLTFPTELLKELGDQNGSGRNGKLCNLEAGWLPKPQSNHIPGDGEHHLLPRHIKQPKTIDQRQKERISKKKLEPANNLPLPYLFA